LVPSHLCVVVPYIVLDVFPYFTPCSNSGNVSAISRVLQETVRSRSHVAAPLICCPALIGRKLTPRIRKTQLGNESLCS
jgi:hypothetical protein